MKWLVVCSNDINGIMSFEDKERSLARKYALYEQKVKNKSLKPGKQIQCWVEPEDYEEYFGHDGFDFAEYLRGLIKCIY